MTGCSPGERGFTLLEVMVALVILAVAAAGLMTAARQSAEAQETLEIRTFAAWVAENRLAEMRGARAWPGPGISQDLVAMAGRNWRIRVRVENTPRPDMRQATVEAGLAGREPFFSLTGFLGRY